MAFFNGSFLVARPILRDPSFRKTVVLLLQHTEEGAFGLVVNRPALVKQPPFPVFSGGPCPSEGMFMLHANADWLADTEERAGREVASGIFLGDSSCIDLVNEAPAEQVQRYRMFTGYAGWGPGQLEGELVEGVWAIVPATAELLFETPAEELWSSLLPPALPQPSVN